jgi:hypothetical protein
MPPRAHADPAAYRRAGRWSSRSSERSPSVDPTSRFTTDGSLGDGCRAVWTTSQTSRRRTRAFAEGSGRGARTFVARTKLPSSRGQLNRHGARHARRQEARRCGGRRRGADSMRHRASTFSDKLLDRVWRLFGDAVAHREQILDGNCSSRVCLMFARAEQETRRRRRKLRRSQTKTTKYRVVEVECARALGARRTRRRSCWIRDRSITVHRDSFACVVPGCRARRNLDVHHVVHRDGGKHSMAQICVLCSGHHQQLHLGRLVISGRAPDLTFRWRPDDDVESATTSPPWDDEDDPPVTNVRS